MIKKTIAICLLAVMLLANNSIAYKSAFEYSIQPSTGNAPGSSDFDSNVNNAVGAGNSLLDTYVDQAKQNSEIDWLRRLNLTLRYDLPSQSWVYGANTIQPFALSFDPSASDMLFFQLNVNKDSTSFYGNGGLGYRTLSEDRKMLFGLNAFYDQDFQNKHQRIGAGAEYFTRWLELRANGYYGISNPVLTGQDNSYWNYQAVVNGFDYGLSLNVPYAEWLKLNATGYNNLQQYTAKTNGYIFGASAQVLPQLQLSYGYNMGQNGLTNSISQVLKFDFNLGGIIGPVLFGSDNETKAIVNKDIAYKLLQPVERQNYILTENYKKLKYIDKGLLVVAIKYSGKPLQNQAVTASLGANQYVAVTNSEGTAIFSGIVPGEYTIGTTVYGTPCVTTAVVNAGSETRKDWAIGSISGKIAASVTDLDENPLAGQVVRAVKITDSKSLVSGLTDSYGRVSFSLASGLYYVYVSKTENPPFPPTDSNAFLTNVSPVICETDKETSCGIAVCGDATGMVVTAKYEDGSPVPDSSVVNAVNASGALTYSRGTIGGIAAFSNMIPQEYIVSVEVGGQKYYADGNPIMVTRGKQITANILVKKVTPTTGSINNVVIYDASTGTNQIPAGTPVNLVPTQSVDPITLAYSTGGISFTGLAFDTYTMNVTLGGIKTVSTIPATLAVSADQPVINGVEGRVVKTGNANVTINFLTQTEIQGKVKAKDTTSGVETAEVNTVNSTATIPNLIAGHTYTISYRPNTGSGVAGDYSYIKKNVPIPVDGGNVDVQLYAEYSPSRQIHVTDLSAQPVVGATVTSAPGGAVGTTGAGGLLTTGLWYACDQETAIPGFTSYTFSAVYGSASGWVWVEISEDANDPPPDGVVQIAVE